MKRSPWRYLLPVLAVLAALAIVLYFINPLGPLLLLASLVIQLPIIYLITRVSMSHGYSQRSDLRKAQFEEDGNAALWLAGEEKEAASVGFSHRSPGAKADNAMNRAEALTALNRRDEAALLLADIDEKKLSKIRQQRFASLAEGVKAPPTDPPPTAPSPTFD